MRGDPDKLIREYAVDFSLRRAMDAAGYSGRNRIYEAARDINERAIVLKSLVAKAKDTPEVRSRILGEYERIAFSDDPDLRTADKLRALEMYRALCEGGTNTELGLVIKYDYGSRE